MRRSFTSARHLRAKKKRASATTTYRNGKGEKVSETVPGGEKQEFEQGFHVWAGKWKDSTSWSSVAEKILFQNGTRAKKIGHVIE